jgi:uncharacterized protein (TIGR03435 family)
MTFAIVMLSLFAAQDLATRGDHAMGFSHEKTTHHFFLYVNGGAIQVTANDPRDIESRTQIRIHLAHIAQMFAEGDFQVPMLVHAEVPPGAPIMKKLKSEIQYTFEEVEQGGRVRIRTNNSEALSAIHEFLRYQISDHQTGDPLNITEALLGQPPAQPRFDVASIKPSVEPGTMYVRTLAGGHLVANAPARLMLMNAYGVQYSQLAGVPDWLGSETWSVDARAEGNPTRHELMLMLQSLLEERFHLKVHRESREMSVYALTIARKGPKLPAPKDGGCAAPVLGQPEPAAPPCGRVRILMSPQGILMEGGGAAVTELARVLAIPLSRPVVDRTALTGAYDIHLQFSNDSSGTTDLPADATNAGIFTAIQEQLGLKLAPAKAPIDVLVIDHIERPTAN